jgi:hypothetical protein
MTLTEVQTQTSQTATFSGPQINISGITTNWTLKLNVQSLADSNTANTPQVRFTFFDSVNQMTASLAGPSFSFKGQLGPSYDKVHAVKQQDYPDLRFGVANAVLQLQLTNINANTCVAEYQAWIES